jgi:hypothetical protein
MRISLPRGYRRKQRLGSQYESDRRFERSRLVRRPRPELDLLDAQYPRLVGLVSIPRPDDRLGSFAAGDDRDGFLG